MAEPGNTAKLERLEQKIGSERAELAQTVDRLQRLASGTAGRVRQLVSVKALKADAGRYATDSVVGALTTARDKAFAHPLQAVAVGAGLAYPLLRVLRLVPPPLLLLGAGLALASRGGDEEGQAHRDLRDGGHGRDAHDDGSHSDDGSVRSQVSTGVHDLADASRRMMHDGVEAGSRMVDGATDWAASSAAAVGATAHRTADGLGRTGRLGGKGLLRGVQEHPFLAGGLVALAGAIVAAALPSTAVEDGLYGGAGDAVKAKAAETARHGLDVVEAAAGRVVESTVQAAQDQGLTPSSAKAAAQGLSDKVQSVVADTADDLASAVQAKSTDARDA